MTGADVRVAFGVDNVDAVLRGVNQVNRALDTVGRQQSGGDTGMSFPGMAAAVATGTVLANVAGEAAGAMVGLGKTALGAGLGFNALKEQASIGFTTMLGSGEKAQTFLSQLQKFAASTPFELPGLIQTSQQLLAFGFKAEQVIPMMTSIGDAVAALGGGPEVMQGVTTALGQMQAKGKVSAEEMNQLAERGIPAWQYVAKAIGTDIPTAMKMAEKGAIPAGQAIEGILAGMKGQFGGMMEAQSHSANGLISTLKDLGRGIAGTFTAKAFARGKNLLEGLVNTLSSPAFEAFAGRAGGAFDAVLGKIEGFVRGAIPHIRSILPVLQGVVTGVLHPIDTLQGYLRKLGQTFPALDGAVGMAIGALTSISHPIDLVQGYARKLADTFDVAVRAVGAFAQVARTSFAGSSLQSGATVADALGQALRRMADAVEARVLPAARLLRDTFMPARQGLNDLSSAALETPRSFALLIRGFDLAATGVERGARGFQVLVDAIVTARQAFRGDWTAGGSGNPFVNFAGGAAMMARRVRGTLGGVRDFISEWSTEVRDAFALLGGNTDVGTPFARLDQALYTIGETGRYVAGVVRSNIGPAFQFLRDNWLAVSLVAGPLIGALLGIGAPLIILGTAVKVLTAAWMGNWGNIQGITQTAIAGVVGWVQGTLLPALAQIGAWVQTNVVPAFDQLAGAIQQGIANAAPGALAFFAGLQTFAAAAAPILAQVGAVILDQLGPALVGLAGWAVETIPMVGAAIGNMAATAGVALSFLAGLISQHSDTIVAVLTGAWGIIAGSIQFQLALIGGIVRTFLAVVSGDWSGAWQTILDTSRNLGAALTGIYTSLGGLLQTTLGQLAGNFVAVGAGLVDGIRQGIEGKWAEFTTWLGEKFGGLLGPVQAALGAHSPSTLFAEGVGVPIVTGVMAGIESQSGALNGMLGGLVNVPGLGALAAGGVAANGGAATPSGTLPAGGITVIVNFNGPTTEAVAADLEERVAQGVYQALVPYLPAAGAGI